jgi:hypothetical protein
MVSLAIALLAAAAAAYAQRTEIVEARQETDSVTVQNIVINQVTAVYAFDLDGTRYEVSQRQNAWGKLQFAAGDAVDVTIAKDKVTILGVENEGKVKVKAKITKTAKSNRPKP